MKGFLMCQGGNLPYGAVFSKVMSLNRCKCKTCVSSLEFSQNICRGFKFVAADSCYCKFCCLTCILMHTQFQSFTLTAVFKRKYCM